MVVQEDVEVPMEIPIEKKSTREAKKFIIVQNHVREIISPDKSDSNMEYARDTCCQMTENISQSLRKKPSTNIKKTAPPAISLIRTEESTNQPTEISNSDLEELRTVYNKCKEVIEKIETKYGHFLNTNAEINSDSLKKDTDHETEEECYCSMNKKIIFKDDGEQETVNTDKQGHICPKKFKSSTTDVPPPVSRNIKIQYSENDIQLPDDLETLSNMLKNPDLEITYRNKVIYKVRSMKQELLNEIKFNKHSLIEKLKENPYELLDFKGTNLASLPGYS